MAYAVREHQTAGGGVAVAGHPGLFLAGAAAGILGAAAAFRVEGVR